MHVESATAAIKLHHRSIEFIGSQTVTLNISQRVPSEFDSSREVQLTAHSTHGSHRERNTIFPGQNYGFSMTTFSSIIKVFLTTRIIDHRMLHSEGIFFSHSIFPGHIQEISDSLKNSRTFSYFLIKNNPGHFQEIS